MLIDPDNPVVKLCAAGMQAEAENRFAAARALMEQAWAARQNDLDACLAAHYLARHQDTLERMLYWNQAALRYAEAVARQITEKGDSLGEINAFFPSLYLNLGKSYEDVGDPKQARHYYEQAQAKLHLLANEYGDIVTRGVIAGLQRTSSLRAGT